MQIELSELEAAYIIAALAAHSDPMCQAIACKINLQTRDCPDEATNKLAQVTSEEGDYHLSAASRAYRAGETIWPE